MTVHEYLATIQTLVREARYEEAMAVSTRHRAAVLPLLTAEEFVYLTGVMEMVDRAIEATEDVPVAPSMSELDTLAGADADGSERRPRPR